MTVAVECIICSQRAGGHLPEEGPSLWAEHSAASRKPLSLQDTRGRRKNSDHSWSETSLDQMRGVEDGDTREWPRPWVKSIRKTEMTVTWLPLCLLGEVQTARLEQAPRWARTGITERGFSASFTTKWLVCNAADGKEVEISKDLTCRNWFLKVV